jgi:DNA polymerase sigma
MTERPFGYSVDICVANINGALNIPRTMKLIDSYPAFKPLLMFLKLFVFVHKIDDPARGGFGSNHLTNLVLFAIQSRRDQATPGQLLVHLLDVLGNQLNPFLAGISTVAGGRLISKCGARLLTGHCPQALVCEDPQFHGAFIGQRTSAATDLRVRCRDALARLSAYDFNRQTAITAIFPKIEAVLVRRRELGKWTANIAQEPHVFALAVANAQRERSVCGAKAQHEIKAKAEKTNREKEATVSKKRKQKQDKKQKQKQKNPNHGHRVEVEEARKRKAVVDFWRKVVRDEAAHNRKMAGHTGERHRQRTPPKFRR